MLQCPLIETAKSFRGKLLRFSPFVLLLIMVVSVSDGPSAAHERVSADYSPPATIKISQVVATADRIADTIPIAADGRASSADAASVVNWLLANAQVRSGDAPNALDGEDAAEWSADMIGVLEMAGVLATYPEPPDAEALRIELISLPTVPLNARDESERRRIETALSLTGIRDAAWAAVADHLDRIEALRARAAGETR